MYLLAARAVESRPLHPRDLSALPESGAVSKRPVGRKLDGGEGQTPSAPSRTCVARSGHALLSAAALSASVMNTEARPTCSHIAFEKVVRCGKIRWMERVAEVD